MSAEKLSEIHNILSDVAQKHKLTLALKELTEKRLAEIDRIEKDMEAYQLAKSKLARGESS